MWPRGFTTQLLSTSLPPTLHTVPFFLPMSPHFIVFHCDWKESYTSFCWIFKIHLSEVSWVQQATLSLVHRIASVHKAVTAGIPKLLFVRCCINSALTHTHTLTVSAVLQMFSVANARVLAVALCADCRSNHVGILHICGCWTWFFLFICYFRLENQLYFERPAIVRWCKLTMTTLLSAGHGWASRSSWSCWAKGWHSKDGYLFLTFWPHWGSSTF